MTIEEFKNIIKYGKCDSSSHGRCQKAGSESLHRCPLPRQLCNCCNTCYSHCVEELRQATDDYMTNFKEWSKWSNRMKRDIGDLLKRNIKF